MPDLVNLRMGATFRLRFLGPVQVERDGKPVRGFRSQKALALLGYLAAQGRPVKLSAVVDAVRKR